ncbi:MAG: 4-hydroxy-tetrahydrodipicolinate synthase [Wenzhouxiangella sp.]
MLQGSLVALVTPMTAAGAIDEDSWRSLLRWQREQGTSGVVVAGTTGESASLSEAEFVRLVSIALEEACGKLKVIAGTGFPSTARSIARTALAARLGADAALVVTPAYTRPSQRGLLAHYLAIADQAEIPVVLYNVPSRTAVDLLPETSLALARHPRVIAIKEAVGDPERVRRLVDGGLRVLSGDDPSCCESMLAGAHGVISVAANVVPGVFARISQLALSGQAEEARRLNAGLQGLYAFLTIEANPVPVKWLLHRMGRIADGLRLPLVNLDPRLRPQADDLMASLDLMPAEHAMTATASTR